MFEACECEWGGDADPIEMPCHTTPKARKEWKCCECHEMIPVGTVHHKLTGRFEGEWFEERWCALCDRIRKDAAPCAPIGMLYEELRNCYGKDVA